MIPQKTPIDTLDTEQNPILDSRVLLARGMEHGIEPPDVHEDGVLLAGKVHQLFAGPGVGKSWVGLWLSKRCIERGERVLYLDMENGPRIVSERLGLLEVDASEVDTFLYYHSSPSLTLRAEDVRNYDDLLDEVSPALVVFDSWANFLASAGLDENSNIDIARWAVGYTQPARNREITVVILDHVPHEGNHSRGASRKKDEVDVQWKVYNTRPFDRESVGEIVLHREKDREAYLPPSVTFSVGGTPDGGFVFERSAGTFETQSGDGLTDAECKALEALRVGFGDQGATATEWQRACEAARVSRATFYRVKRELTGKGEVSRAGERYFPRDTSTTGSGIILPFPRETPESRTDTPNAGRSHEVSREVSWVS